ncbi:MAG: phosphatase PAP2-related protein [Candidatus Pacearchaeota archaeon]|jgi:hypothetical protein
MGIFESWKNEISKNKKVIFFSILFLILANFSYQIAGEYVDEVAGVQAQDIILDNIPTINLSFLYIYGGILMLGLLIFYPLFFNVKKFHVSLSQLSLLLIIRSFFISLTHLKVPADAVEITIPKLYNLMTFNNDLFFSGHTALPFLGFLMFRKEKIGIFFLILTFVMMITVLFMHFHYSIDVFAALFITYGSFKIGQWLFKGID